MAIKFANTDAGVTWDITVSKAAGSTLYYTFLLDGVNQTISGDTWQFLVKNAAGTTVVTLTSGSGLTIAGSLITAVLSVSSLSALTPGGFSYELDDTTASRTRISGNLILTA